MTYKSPRGGWASFGGAVVIVFGVWASLILFAQRPEAQPVPGAENGANSLVVSQLDNLNLLGLAVINAGGAIGTCTAACASTTLLGPVDVTGFNSVVVNYLNLGTSGVNVAAQGSIDSNGPCSAATNWGNAAGNYVSPNGFGLVAAQVGTGFGVPFAVAYPTASFRCFRLQITAWVSGTVQVEGLAKGGEVYPSIPNVIHQQYIPWGAFGGTSQVTWKACAGTGTTAAVTCSLPASAGQTTYICGFDVSELQGATAGTFSATIGTLEGSLTYTYSGQNAISGASVIGKTFTPCVPASAANQAVTVTANANANASAVDVQAWGFQD